MKPRIRLVCRGLWLCGTDSGVGAYGFTPCEAYHYWHLAARGAPPADVTPP